MKLVSLNEPKLEAIFETLDYKEPFDPECTHEGIQGEHDHFKLAQKRITKFKIYNITNPLCGEDLINLAKNESGDEIIHERCMVKWSH